MGRSVGAVGDTKRTSKSTEQERALGSRNLAPGGRGLRFHVRRAGCKGLWTRSVEAPAAATPLGLDRPLVCPEWGLA